jgi:hypothetical protein
MAFSYDLAVAYRIYPKVAKPALGLPLGEDKLRLAEACLRSFRECLGTLRIKLWVLLDACLPEYEEMFLKYFDREEVVLLPLKGVGNLGTFERQIDILQNQTDAQTVYFAEDDYYYLPDQFRIMIDFLRAYDDVDFVTPYDHLDCYNLELHHRPKWLRVSADHHWRTAGSTCLTFLTTREKLQHTAQVFRTYCRENSDASLWLSLTKQAVWNPFSLVRYARKRPWLAKITLKAWLYGWRQLLFGRRRHLWVPVPGIATHMDANALSPAVDWRSLMEQQSSVDVDSALIPTSFRNFD